MVYRITRGVREQWNFVLASGEIGVINLEAPDKIQEVEAGSYILTLPLVT